jgi:hypothetical protein
VTELIRACSGGGGGALDHACHQRCSAIQGESQARTAGWELAGKPSHPVKLGGTWWASWQTFREGAEKIASQQVEIKQEGDRLQVATISRCLPVEEGGYHWSGELRLWDNEVLLGWYAASDGSIRSKGTMYFVLHPHGLNMSGRWTGLGYDGRIMTGWGSMGQTQEESEQTMARLISSEGMPDINE